MLLGTIISVAYAFKAHLNEEMAFYSMNVAYDRSQQAKAAEERATDALVRGQFEQARALRLAGRPGWRDKALGLLTEIAPLRDRAREFKPLSDLPTAADLRGEAVMALIARDMAPLREMTTNLIYGTHFSADGRRMVQAGFAAGRGGLGMTIVDLTTGAVVHSTNLATEGPVEESIALSQIQAVNADATRAVCQDPVKGGFAVHDLPSGEARRPPRRVRVARGPHDPRPVQPRRPSVLGVRPREGTAELVCWEVAKPEAPRVVARQPLPKKKVELGDDGGLFAALRFAPDSNRVSFATEDRKTVRVLDLSADPPAVVAEFVAPGPVGAAEWHPTASAVALVVEADETKTRVVLWDLAEKRLRATYGPDAERGDRFGFGSGGIAFHPAGRWLAVASPGDPTVRVYGALDGAEQFRVPDVATVGVARVTWTADGDLLTVGAMEDLRVWRPAAEPACETYPVARPTGDAGLQPRRPTAGRVRPDRAAAGPTGRPGRRPAPRPGGRDRPGDGPGAAIPVRPDHGPRGHRVFAGRLPAPTRGTRRDPED